MPSRLAIRPYTKSILFYQGGVVSSLVKTTPAGINIGTNPTTVAAWVYMTSDLFGTVLSFEASSGGSRAMGLGQIAGIYYVFSDGITVNKTITKAQFEANVGINKWLRVVFSVSGSNVDVWVNGFNILSTSNAISTGSLARISIGKRFVGGVDIQPFQGYMKDMQIYNNYFTNADAQLDYFDNIRPYTPVSSFLMEEGTGSTVADQVGSNTLTATSINWSSLVLPMSARKLVDINERMAPRIFGSCVDVFTGAGILVNNAASLNPTDYVALEAWVKPILTNASPSPATTFLAIFDNSQAGATFSYFLDVLSDGRLRWYSTIGGVAKNIVATTTAIQLNRWSFISAHYNGSVIEIFANGQLMGTLAASGALGTNSGQLRIGQYFSTASAGRICAPRVYHSNQYSLAFHRARYYDNLEDPTMNATLVLNMPMNEGGLSTVADVSGLGNNGAFTRAIWDNLVPLSNDRVIRNYAQSLKFNGTSDYIDLGASGPIAAATATFTASIWLKRDKDTGITAMFGDNDNAAQRHWNFQIQGPNRKLLTTLITSVGTKALVGNGAILAGQWYHAVLTYDGSFIRFYINGYIDASTNHTGTVLASTLGMNIGTGSAPVGGAFRYFGGNLCDAKYWDRALSAQEIYELYFDARNDSVIRTGLKGEWLLQGNVLDTSGQGNHGTLFGGTFETANVPMRDRLVLA